MSKHPIARAGRPSANASKELDARILDTARTLFVEMGYASVSIEQIAKTAGVGKLTIYRRYASKETLFTAVLAEIMQVVPHALERAQVEAPDPVEAMRLTARALLDLIVTHDAIELYRVLLGEANRFPELVSETVRKIIIPLERQMEQSVELARHIGKLRKEFSDQTVVRMLSGLLTGWAINQALLGAPGLSDTAARDEFFDQAWVLFTKGILTDGSGV
jgi:AcrR family transcriptional regulator